MVATCVMLTLVHKRHRLQHYKEVQDYYYEQLEFVLLSSGFSFFGLVNSCFTASDSQLLRCTLQLRIGTM